MWILKSAMKPESIWFERSPQQKNLKEVTTHYDYTFFRWRRRTDPGGVWLAYFVDRACFDRRPDTFGQPHPQHLQRRRQPAHQLKSLTSPLPLCMKYTNARGKFLRALFHKWNFFLRLCFLDFAFRAYSLWTFVPLDFQFGRFKIGQKFTSAGH